MDEKRPKVRFSEESVIVEEENAEKNVGEDNKEKKKRNRKRKKVLYGKILQQMEFYFSDANITKNRMMLEMISASEYVPLEQFLEFNRIKNLNATVEDIRNSLEKSEKLEGSEDGKFGVKRKVPYDPNKLKSEAEIEECTVYVENVPRHVAHEWLEKIFLSFGPIAYISLPKFKISGQPKGFAFIEYEKKESADGCIEAYQGQGAILTEEMNPGHLMSVQTFAEEQQLIKKEATPASRSPTRSQQSQDSTSGDNRKRKLEDTATEETPKKSKTHHLLQTPEVKVEVKIETEEIEEENKQESEKKAKKRNRKKNKMAKTEEEKLEGDSISLRVMHKQTWRQLRNRYLNLQRQNMTKLKKQLREEHLRRQHYGNCQPYLEETKRSGPIVEIQLDTPAESVEAFKTQIKVDLSGQSQEEAEISQFVKYVDYEDGGSFAYIRFSEDESFIERVKTFVQNADKVFRGVKVLTTQEALDYKAQVHLALKNKGKGKSRKKERGKDRLLKAAARSSQHIQYDGEDLEGKPTISEIKVEEPELQNN